MKKAIICMLLALTGCSHFVPVKQTMPDLPKELSAQCPPLKKIPDNPKLSEISKTVAENYTLYYECAANNSGLIEWYSKQKQIFDEVK